MKRKSGKWTEESLKKRRDRYRAKGYTPRIPYEKRFWNKVDRRSEEECWNWTGCSRRAGSYGLIFVNKATGYMSAHRASWAMANGPIPDGMFVLHRCDNQRCVNPGHLFIGTQLDNSNDKVSKGRHIVGARTRFVKLTEEQVLTIRLIRNMTTKTYAELSAEFGVTKSAICSLVNRKSWKHI